MVDLIIIGSVGINWSKGIKNRLETGSLQRIRREFWFCFILSDKMLDLLSGNRMANFGQGYPLGKIYTHHLPFQAEKRAESQDRRGLMVRIHKEVEICPMALPLHCAQQMTAASTRGLFIQCTKFRQ